MDSKQPMSKVESSKNKKKLRAFLLFLTMSFLFWMLIKLSEEYIADVNFKVEYGELPSKKLLQTEPEDHISLTVRTVGFKLLKYRVKEKVLNYSLKNVKQKRKSIYYSQTNTNLNLIQAQFSAETEVLKIKPDTLFFDFGTKYSKSVKVVPDIKMDFKSGFNLVEDVKITPDKVKISGPQGILDSIDEIKSKLIEIDNISESFKKDIELLLPNSRVSLAEDKVLLSAKVDKYTEGSFTLPFEVINVPKNSIIRTYPKEVKVVFKVVLSDYNKVVPDSFKVTCDFKTTIDNDLKYLVPKLIEQPELITSVRIVPNKIEYLVKSK